MLPRKPCHGSMVYCKLLWKGHPHAPAKHGYYNTGGGNWGIGGLRIGGLGDWGPRAAPTFNLELAETLLMPVPILLHRLLFLLVIAHDAKLAPPALPGAELGVAVGSVR